jgi:hypothetical protein
LRRRFQTGGLFHVRALRAEDPDWQQVLGNEVHVPWPLAQSRDKVGYSSLSFGGRFGRSARIDVDAEPSLP